jgi:hypothetical protein
MVADEPTPTRPYVRRRERRGGLVLVFLRWRWLDGLHRFALALCLAIGVAALTTIPEFGWLDATQVLLAVAATRVVARAVEDDPHPLPFLDGTLLATAGFWNAAVTTINALAGAVLNTQVLIFGCSALLAFCGLRLRAIERAGWAWD